MVQKTKAIEYSS